MRFTTIITSSLPVIGAFAAPLAGTATTDSSRVAARACAPISSPTAPYSVVAVAPNTAIHYMTINAGPDHTLILGGEPDVPPCPLADQSGCPPGAYTVFNGFGSLYVSVPGGQQVYVGPKGRLGFTAAHSATTPADAVLDPFTYEKVDQCTPNGEISSTAFGASGFMACPTISNTADPANVWKVWADFPGAQVPTGYRGDCIPFRALTTDYDDANFGGYHAAAYQYD